MKKISVFALVSLLALFIFSCGSEKAKEEAAEEAAEEFVEGLLEKASGENINIDINEDGETAEMTIEGADGEKITIKNEGTEIPENFPDDVYLVKGEIESVGSMASGEGEIITVVINPKDGFNDVVAKIKKEMKENGWTSTMNMNMGKDAMLMYTKGENSVTITVNGKDDKVEAAYIVTTAKK